MIQVPLNQVKDELSRYLRMAETEDIIITRHGVPAVDRADRHLVASRLPQLLR